MLRPPPDPRLQKFVDCAPPEGTGIVYAIVNSTNHKKYIGITVQALSKRYTNHCSKSSRCKALSSAIAKYGRNGFELYVLDHVDLMYIREAEKESIKINNSMAPIGYNLDEGGMGIDITDAERERRRQQGKQQYANESAEKYIKRIMKHKATKATPEFKARASHYMKKNAHVRLNDPDFEKKRDERRQLKLDAWRKIALPLPSRPRDRIVGKKYIDSNGVLYAAYACKGQAPVLKRLSMDQFERERIRDRIRSARVSS